MLFRSIVTEMGQPEYYLVPLALVGIVIFARTRRVQPQIALAFAQIGAAGLVANLLKITLGRCRPKLLWANPPEYGFTFFSTRYDYTGFPSGHSAVAFGLAVALTTWKPKLWPVWFAIALVIAGSRIVTGSHYPSDVLGGAATGAAMAILVHRFFRARKLLPLPTPPVVHEVEVK